MNRDSVIDIKLVSLIEKKQDIEKQLSEMGDYVTNLQVCTNDGKIINLRTVNTVDKLAEAFGIINSIKTNRDNFKTLIANDLEDDLIIFGYKWSDWVHDFQYVYKKMTITEKLLKVNDAIKNIEKFYSGDRKEENAFNKLLNDIDSI